MMLDQINSFFEAGACFALALHCVSMYKSKDSRSVSLISVAFFTAWGVWNLFYYSGIGHTFSFIASVGAAIVHFVWLFMTLYYRDMLPRMSELFILFGDDNEQP